MKGLYCRAGVAEPKFVIQETVSVCVSVCVFFGLSVHVHTLLKLGIYKPHFTLLHTKS